MKRALFLAGKGEGRVSPNPMVGAVIVSRGRIIGEGFHAFYGGPHAEVNAIRSVKEEDRELLKEATIYVTLEPCAHYGKTPPCAGLIVETGIPEVVVGCLDPNPKVAGKGIEILENAGIKVKTGVLEKECEKLNRKFLKAHRDSLPYIILKWAESADGFMAKFDKEGNPEPVKFSTPISTVWMHRQRAGVDAIMVGANTERIDKPRLNVRLWGGDSPKKFVADSSKTLAEQLTELRADGITSVLVEGGPKLLESFIKEGFYDELRVEKSPIVLGNGLKSPGIPKDVVWTGGRNIRENRIDNYLRE